MFNLRERYPFDHPIACDGVKYYNIFAVSPDRCTFYVEAGACNGVRLLAHYDANGDLYVAESLHARTLVRANGGEEKFLRLAADRAKRRVALIPAHEVPGFEQNEGRLVHLQGWLSASFYAMPMDSPEFAPEAKVWDIREGVYMSFPDGSIRLARRPDYWSFWREFMDRQVVSRQGDLLFFVNIRNVWDFPSVATEADHRRVFGHDLGLYVTAGGPGTVGQRFSVRPEAEIDRHVFSSEDWVVRHPEHGEMPLPTGDWVAVLLPGTSRPFQRDGGVD